MPDRPPRIHVDLRQSMSAATRGWLALAVAAVVAVLAWWQGHNRPVPAWITEWLVPALGWTWLALAAVALVGWWRRRQARLRVQTDQGDRS